MKINKSDFIIRTIEDQSYIYHIPSKKISKINKEFAEKLMNELDTGLDDESRLNSIIDQEVFQEDTKYNFKSKNDFCINRKLNRLELVTSTFCNLNCKYCYALGGSYGKRSS